MLPAALQPLVNLGREMDVAQAMVSILMGMGTGLFLLFQLLTPAKATEASWLPSEATAHGQKLAYERFVLAYTPIWIGCFAVIIAFQLYELFDEWWYFIVCGGLCIPLFLYPYFTAPDVPLTERYAFKANLWLAIYSHIGNYWYTHYFYTVLKAKYSMPSWRLNDVPIPFYFATFFYFSTYHVFSNVVLRRICTGYRRDTPRALFLAAVVVVMSYFTAFAETLTISGFPYYSFEDRDMAYKIGSAFYGIYFLVSFPAFFRLDEFPEGELSTYQAMMDSLGAGMLILILLDAVRLVLGIPLTIGVSA